MTDAIVIGGGLAGCAAALRLVDAGLDVRLLEAGERLGGVVGTLRERDARGRSWLFETGPHSVPATATTFGELVERLGLTGRVVRSKDAARERLLLRRGGLVRVPSSPPGLLATPLVSWRTKLRFLSEPRRRFVPPADGSEPTLHDFVAERFGEDAARVVAGAFVRGVYAGEATRLGARSAFPRLWDGVLEHGSVLRFLKASAQGGSGAARGELLSFEGGLGELPEAFARALGERVEHGACVTAIDRDAATRTFVVRTQDARHVAPRVVLAAPARTALALLRPLVVPSTEAASALDGLVAMRSNGVRLVHLGLEPPLPPGLPRGFGFLVPPDEAERRDLALLGALVPSNARGTRAGGLRVRRVLPPDGRRCGLRRGRRRARPSRVRRRDRRARRRPAPGDHPRRHLAPRDPRVRARARPTVRSTPDRVAGPRAGPRPGRQLHSGRLRRRRVEARDPGCR
ncbi:MAG: protoporphyrinogen oxidase [Planctomycetota bacterium]